MYKICRAVPPTERFSLARKEMWLANYAHSRVEAVDSRWLMIDIGNSQKIYSILIFQSFRVAHRLL